MDYDNVNEYSSHNRGDGAGWGGGGGGGGGGGYRSPPGPYDSPHGDSDTYEDYYGGGPNNKQQGAPPRGSYHGSSPPGPYDNNPYDSPPGPYDSPSDEEGGPRAKKK